MHIYISMSQYVPSEYHFLIIHFPSLFITLLSYLIKIANIEEKKRKKKTLYIVIVFSSLSITVFVIFVVLSYVTRLMIGSLQVS